MRRNKKRQNATYFDCTASVPQPNDPLPFEHLCLELASLYKRTLVPPKLDIVLVPLQKRDVPIAVITALMLLAIQGKSYKSALQEVYNHVDTDVFDSEWSVQIHYLFECIATRRQWNDNEPTLSTAEYRKSNWGVDESWMDVADAALLRDRNGVATVKKEVRR